VRVKNLTRGTLLADRATAATTSRERRTGLLRHESLAEGEGLWIAPCEAIHTFGMKFPIDVVFLDRAKRVVKIREAVPAGRIAVCLRAHSVLELPAGAVRRTGTAVGDQLAFEPSDRGTGDSPPP
jgi:uncharacterized membrane protein (UPF0127 family)